MQITVKYGCDQISKSFDAAPTVAELKENDSLQAALGYGDNVRVLMNGVALSDGTTIPSGAVVTIETAANEKA